MRTIRPIATASLALLLSCATAWSQQQPDPNDPKDPKDQSVQSGQGPSGGIQISGGGGVFRIAMPGPGPGGPGMFGMGGDHLNPLVMTLGELNLAPDFSLTGEQKTKIQSIRDEFKQAMEMWKKDHAEDLKQLDDQQKELEENLRNGNPPDPQMMMEQFEQRRVLMETAPNGEDQANQVKSTLDDAQRKRLEERLTEQEKQREEMMQRMPMRLGPGGARWQGQHVDKDKDKDKDEKEKDKGK